LLRTQTLGANDKLPSCCAHPQGTRSGDFTLSERVGTPIATGIGSLNHRVSQTRCTRILKLERLLPALVRNVAPRFLAFMKTSTCYGSYDDASHDKNCDVYVHKVTRSRFSKRAIIGVRGLRPSTWVMSCKAASTARLSLDYCFILSTRELTKRWFKKCKNRNRRGMVAFDMGFT
jgi:hypothetical protein